jgi:hypothetical protein
MIRPHGVVWVVALVAFVRGAMAEVVLVDDRLYLDAASFAGGYWWRADQSGLTQSEFGAERPGAFVGLTGHAGRVASLRVSANVSELEPRDLFVDLRWTNGLCLRAGQLVPPIGMDGMTEPYNQPLIGSSFLASFAKPGGVRDVGVTGSWESGRMSVAAAIVDGRGANASDNNNRKDFCGRLTVRPLVSVDAEFAARTYYGWPDTLWRTAALEARVVRGPLTLQVEFQNLRSKYARNNTAYLQAIWEVGSFEPAGRFDIILPEGQLPEWMILAGLGFRVSSEHLRVMSALSYHRNYQGNWSVFGFGLRLQAML